MTMNIMSVSISATPELSATNKSAAEGARTKETAGFAELFSKESDSQAATSQSKSPVITGSATQSQAKEEASTTITDTTITSEANADSELTATSQSDMADEPAETSSSEQQAQDENKLKVSDAVESDGEPMLASVALTQTELVPLAYDTDSEPTKTAPASKLAASTLPTETLSPENLKSSTNTERAQSAKGEKAAELSQGERNLKASHQEASSQSQLAKAEQANPDSTGTSETKRQGGSALPPDALAKEGRALDGESPKSPALSASSNSQAEQAGAKLVINSTAEGEEQGEAELTNKSQTTAQSAQALQANRTPESGLTTPLAARSPLAATQTNAIPGAEAKAPVAPALGEYSDISIELQTSEQAAKSETSQRTLELASGARGAAPEWLAQIEHGRRWSQGAQTNSARSIEDAPDSKGATLTDHVASTSLANSAGQSTAALNAHRAINQTFAQAARESTINSFTASEEGVTTTAQQDTSTGQEASGLLMAREQTLLAATPERTAMLDKPLTLHGSAEQNAKQLAQQAQVLVSQNLQEAEIKLNPSEFGAMRIQIRMEQGEVQVQFVASHPQARELLEQAMPRLRDMLHQQGMNLHQGQQHTGQQQSGQQQQQQAGQQAASQTNSQFLSQQGGGQAGQQQADHQSQAGSLDADSSQWRSYSANGDEVQEQSFSLRQRAPLGTEGAKIDFFA